MTSVFIYYHSLNLEKFNKSDFLPCLERLFHAERIFPNVSVRVFGGFWSMFKDFYGKLKILLKYSDVTRIDIPFDCYFKESLKKQTHQSGGKGRKPSVQETTPI